MLAWSALASLAIAADVQFRDDFDGKLKPGWQWIDPKGDCAKSLDARPGFLRITVEDYHDLWPVNQDYYAPRLLREAGGPLHQWDRGHEAGSIRTRRPSSRAFHLPTLTPDSIRSTAGRRTPGFETCTTTTYRTFSAGDP